MIMVKIERIYNVPLRQEYQKVPKYKRAKKAVSALRDFLKKHMKSDDVRIGIYLNEKIWENGIKNPPHHIRIQAVKDEEGIVYAELIGKKIETVKEREEREKKKELEKEKKDNKEENKKEDKKEENKKEENKEKEQKEEKKEQKKESETKPKETLTKAESTKDKEKDNKTNKTETKPAQNKH